MPKDCEKWASATKPGTGSVKEVSPAEEEGGEDVQYQNWNIKHRDNELEKQRNSEYDGEEESKDHVFARNEMEGKQGKGAG